MNEPFGNSEQLGTDAWNGWDARARLDNEAPARIWLQIDTAGDNDERDVPWPGSEHVTWQDESIGGLEVEYVRADLAARQPVGVEPGAIAELIEAAKVVNGDRLEPHDCYATGPSTGDPFLDLVRCPGCRLAEALARVGGGT